MIYHGACKKNNMTDSTFGAGSACPFGTLNLNPGV
jgi:hypothetical protein